MRIGRDTIMGIAAEDQIANLMPIIPVEPPESFFEVLSLESPASSKEIELLGEFYNIFGALNMCRNTLYLVKRSLDQSQVFERQLAEGYQCRVQDELQALSVQRQQWSDKAIALVEGNAAGSELIRFYELCLSRFEQFDHIEEIDMEQFSPLNILVDLELHNAFSQYMDAVSCNPSLSQQ